MKRATSPAPSGLQSATAYQKLLRRLERETLRTVKEALALTADLAANLPPEPWLSEQLEGEKPFVVTALWAGNDELTYALAQVVALARQGASISTEHPWGVPADREAIWRELRRSTPPGKAAPKHKRRAKRSRRAPRPGARVGARGRLLPPLSAKLPIPARPAAL